METIRQAREEGGFMEAARYIAENWQDNSDALRWVYFLYEDSEAQEDPYEDRGFRDAVNLFLPETFRKWEIINGDWANVGNPGEDLAAYILPELYRGRAILDEVSPGKYNQLAIRLFEELDEGTDWGDIHGDIRSRIFDIPRYRNVVPHDLYLRVLHQAVDVLLEENFREWEAGVVGRVFEDLTPHQQRILLHTAARYAA